MFELKDREYEYISRAVYDYAKINLTENKKPLIVSRLSKRIRKLDLKGFSQYIEYLERDGTGEEFQIMVDSLSTNFSNFFRETHHFEFLKEKILEEKGKASINIWSAASSTGQEVYSIAMTIADYERETGQRISANLYASDISRRVLEIACRGIYEVRDIQNIERETLRRYFLRGTGEKQDLAKVKNEIIKKILFFRLNLNDEKYDLPLMDVIFLRNAIIYFDMKTKTELIDKLHSYLKPGGYLFLGHSESLSGISDKFKLIGKTVYRRADI